MTIFQATILGLVQGVTEFLPVSSSGHLVIFQHLLGLETDSLLFDVLVHLATLLVVLIYFKDRLLSLNTKQIKLLIVGTIPAVIAGLFIEDYIEAIFSSLWYVAFGLLLTATLLFLSHRQKNLKKKLSKMSFKDSLIIGIFQAVAILPGISRSGSTVAGAFFKGLKKEDAFYFSFLLAIPAILGATVLQLKDITSVSQLLTMPNLFGFLSAGVSGFFALKMLDLVIHKAKLHYFGYYCIVLSLGIMIYLVQ